MATKKRLIDANALIKRLLELEAEPDYRHPGEDWDVGVCMAEFIVDEMPTVDAVEVVRCKDCKHFKLGEYGICYCKRDKLSPGKFMRNIDFCSYGERRTDNG